MFIDVHWCPLMSIGIPFVWLFCLWSPTSSKGGRTNGFPVKSSTPFSKGILCASWYKRPGKTKKAKLQNGQNDIGQITLSQLSAVNRSQLVSTSDSIVSIFRRTDTVQGLRRSTAFEPTGLKLHVKGALDTFLQERPASFHDSIWDIWEWYAKKLDRHHSSVDSSHAEGASVYFCFHMISLNFQGNFCKTCLRCVQEDRCVERFFLLRQLLIEPCSLDFGGFRISSV